MDQTAVSTLSAALGVSLLTARLLVGRGLIDVADAQAFLQAELRSADFDAERIRGLADVAAALHEALHRRSRILIFGDYDVDGITATAIMWLALRDLGAPADYLLPSRLADGYGLSPASVQQIITLHPETLLTVDNGIAAAAAVEELRAAGIEVLITDHHAPANLVPQSVPVADPWLDVEGYGQELSGSGVALALVKLLGTAEGQPELWRDYLDLASLGIIADMMPLLGLNRALVRAGLIQINQTPRPGFQALFSYRQNANALSSVDLSFDWIPRLNAAGRLGQADTALLLLLSADFDSASQLAAELEILNQQRRHLESELFNLALAEASAGWQEDQRLVVAAGEDWHEGLIGIVASRLARHFGVPALVFSLKGEQAKGSGRSVGTVDLFAAIQAVRAFTLQNGGHSGAVGVTLERDQLSAFQSALAEQLKTLPESCFAEALTVDARLALGDLSWSAVQELRLLEPFGAANPTPLFASFPLRWQDQRVVGQKHLRFTATDSSASCAAIWFNCPDIETFQEFSGYSEVLFEAQADLWQGRQTVQMHIREAWTLRGQAALNAAFLPAEQTLHASQKQALAELAAGKSPLCVLPTGRGKSLIFQLHAARLALAHGSEQTPSRPQASIFVYPLRALLTDQQQHLNDRLASLGLSSQILCGQNSWDERSAAYAALSAGRLAVILTTPEYLLLHARQLAEAADICFVAIDEAHHLAQRGLSGRPAYRRLAELRQLFPRSQFLAATATADPSTAQLIQDELALDSLILDRTRRPNLRLVDERAVPDKYQQLLQIVGTGQKTLVYLGSRLAAQELTRQLRKDWPEGASTLAFYHAGLRRETRKQLAQDFYSGQLSCLLSTTAFGEGLNLPDIRQLVLYQSPFSRTALNQLAGRAGRDGQAANIHLLFQESDVQQIRQLLAGQVPDRNSLTTLYRYLRGLSSAGIPINFSDDSLALASQRWAPNGGQTPQQIDISLRIFAELG
ncbi:MAG: single-stranded-DNA-specific exonuclease RecJ, partial [Actinomycetia bacterium]|nr:single-stranded-DNA-specific exonuclease RecJ [Actinomycetes bacterium]